jgi:hypothetical protein
MAVYSKNPGLTDLQSLIYKFECRSFLNDTQRNSAITYLKAIPNNNPYHTEAQKLIIELTKNIDEQPSLEIRNCVAKLLIIVSGQIPKETDPESQIATTDSGYIINSESIKRINTLAGQYPEESNTNKFYLYINILIFLFYICALVYINLHAFNQFGTIVVIILIWYETIIIFKIKHDKPKNEVTSISPHYEYKFQHSKTLYQSSNLI